MSTQPVGRIDEVLLTKEEAAKRLGFTVGWVHRLVKRGLLAQRVRSGRSYVTELSVESYAAGRDMSRKELAAKVLELEHKLNLLLGKQGLEEFENHKAMLRTNHPELFS